ncbi:ribosome biogenesis GTPase Der [Patescibacteria group bacterium]|nr:ribosome biogenesis GTPase Der [Patescibacteria group bacterium]MBU1890169.1 ribosome biogenesis GTPase Der [Patescibacteria group bacterium]
MSRVKTVALIGRTNVGKSTLFNRLIEETKAIVSNQPGTTRDRNEAFVYWRGNKFKLIDTGGIDIDPTSAIEQSIVQQVKTALVKADLILLVVDGQVAPMAQDREAARLIQNLKCPSFIVVNKIDSPISKHTSYHEYYKLGLSKMLPVSGRNGVGSGDLLDAIYYRLFLNKSPDLTKESPTINIAIIGKPNVGKSSIINILVGEERSIVTPIPHTTRESHDTLLQYHDDLICLVDTAGLRKSSKIKKAYKKTKTLEKDSAQSTLESIKKCDVALLVLDLSSPITQQDKRLTQLIAEQEKGLVVIANKSDLVNDLKPYEINKIILSAFPFLKWAPVLIVSAKTKRGVKQILPQAIAVKSECYIEIEQAKLNGFIRQITQMKRPPITTAKKKTTAKLRIEQIRTGPPAFQVSTNVPGSLPAFYLRFIEHQLRASFGLVGTPIKISFKKYYGKK